ncbi:aldo/keto reductase, partial [Ruminococcus sp.]
MKTMKLGKTGIDISRMGLGTWSIGGGSAWGGDHDLQVVVDTIREAPKLGVNLIDTAPGYNFGNSEKIIGKALEQMNREDVVIITKCGVTWDQE